MQDENNPYRKEIPNIFSGGMRRDFHEGDGDNTSYWTMMNGRRVTETQWGIGVTNDLSNRLFSNLPAKVVGGGYLDSKNRFIVFLENNEIGWVKTDHEGNGEYEKIASGCWDFNQCEWMYFEAKTWGSCQETTLYFSSNCTYYRVPIEEAMSPKGSGLSCDDFLLFRCVCGPVMIPKVLEAGGGNLSVGAYQFVVQLEDRDGNRTNWFHVSHPVYITSADNRMNDISSQYIQLNIKELDPRFVKANIGVIKTVGGLRTLQWVDTLFYNTRGITFEYYGPTGREKDLTETDIINKKTMYYRGQDLIQRDGVLYLYRLLPPKNLDYQRRANNIQISIPKFAVPANEIHKYPTMMRSSRIVLGIIWKHCDGTYTFGFEIPANAGGSTFTPRRRDTSFPTGSETNPDPDDGQTTPTGGIGSSEGAVDVILFEPVKYELDKIEHEEFMNEFADIIDQFDTRFIDTCRCLDCGAVACNEDMPDFERASATYVDFLEDMVKSHEFDGGSGDFLEAIKNFVHSFIEEAKDKKYERAKYRHTSPAGPNPLAGASGTAARSRDEEAGEWGDSNAVKIGETATKTFLTTWTYPLTKDCHGEYIYGSLAGRRGRVHELPSAAEEPFFFSGQEGVPNRYHPDNDPFQGYFVTLGIKASNIEFPHPSELEKPLCPNQPYEIVMAPRDEFNNDIIAKGMMFHTFQGQSHGKTQLYPKHGVNSVEYFDKNIDNGGGDRRGQNGSTGAYVFHSPDTSMRKPPLNPFSFENELEQYGVGWRYGLYAEGRPPDGYFEQQLDQRGTRQAINLNQQTPKPSRRLVNGITYAQGNKIIPAPPGATYDLCNIYRESSVYVELGGMLPGLSNTGGACNGADSDLSFTGDGIDHECMLRAGAAHYGLLRRRILNMYGSPVQRKYRTIGLLADRPGQTTIEGVVGDSWLGFHTIKRTGYVADGQGEEELHRPDPPYKWVFRFFMMNDKTRLPKSGDLDDPKNMLDLHGGVRCGTVTCTGGESTYYPRLVKTLVIFPVESMVNVNFRQTDDPMLNQVFFPKLKGMALDTNFPSGTDWPNAWLNRFYAEVRRPSKFQQSVSTFLKTAAAMAPPMWWTHELIQTDAPTDWDFVSWMAATPGVMGMWLFFVFFMFRTRMLEDMLQIPRPLKDSENGQYEDEHVKQWEDNYFEYNSDFSVLDDINLYIGMPDPYETQDCSGCPIGNHRYGCFKEGPCKSSVTTNEIIYSNKQNPESPIDAYINFEVNSYFEIGANEGLLLKLFQLNNNFYAHLTDGIAPLYNRQETILSESELTLGPVTLFRDPANIAQGIYEGYWGNEDPNAAIVTPYGYFFIDQEARSIYRFLSPSQVDDLTLEKYGMSNFFKEHLPFCALENNACHPCVDEKSESGVYYTMGVDHRHKRLLLTKKDEKKGSFTIGFDLSRLQWEGFHSYIPKEYFWDRNHLYSVKGSQIWKHDDNRGDHQRYFGEYHPFYIEYPTIVGNRTAYNYASHRLYTEANIWDESAAVYIRSRRYNFNELLFYSSDQSTGELKLVIPDKKDRHGRNVQKGDIIEIVDAGRYWRINEIRNSVVDPNRPILQRNGKCDPFYTSAQGNIDYVNKPQMASANFEDFYHMTRLTLNDPKMKHVQLILRKSLILVTLEEI